ncbi:hypothetical protein [Geothrix rubra]|uniref:hypothetical protein n=1 Tax=Geothrix rubra TaxID=2927977 RepID=UPI002556B9EF|nr:hypothetical protein [Geothrix rubra]
MNKEEFAWIVVRALGVVSLWLFALAAFGFVVFALGSVAAFVTMSMETISRLGFIQTTIRSGITSLVEMLFYGFLSSYLLRKGQFVHRLLLKNVPSA